MTRLMTSAIACAATVFALSAAPEAHADPVVRVGVDAPRVIVRGPAPTASTRVVVRASSPGPATVAVARPVRPGPSYHWVAGHWRVTDRGARVWVEGHWQRNAAPAKRIVIVR